MTSASDQDSQALHGAIVPTFFKYLGLDVLGLIAMTSAMLVDGLFIGNYVGVEALAAVNLIIPISTLLFGVGMMLSIGGSVRAGKYLGEEDKPAASAIFSKTLMFMALYGAAAISLALIFEEALFTGLGASRELFPVMSEYYRIIMPFLLAQLIVLALYYFIRLDGYPNLVATALTIGALVNILLDYLFIGRFGWGLTGAALATGISQALPLPVMMIYWRKPGRRLRFGLRQRNWKEVFQAAYNGVSEFINEVAGGIVVLILNWMLLQRIGVHGVAAMTVVNYTMLLGYMMFFAISDTIQVMISQNFGARNAVRMTAFLKTAASTIAMLSAFFITVLLTVSEPIIRLFVDDRDSAATVAMATEFVTYIWPLFLFAGVNILLSGYLTAIHRPLQSGTVALCHSLILPAAFLALAYWLLADQRFVVALPAAEAATCILAVALFLWHLPAKAVRA
ncbi:MAG: multidrug transporter MatE [Gammaproteobacteria bacterium]|nr:multidrug transporter MatE [Gammaproteobacteria bacterium]MYK84280.1 multidrug transporter MatE [Gammaproteobacteria bacterium]